jgi:hypothetical protein
MFVFPLLVGGLDVALDKDVDDGPEVELLPA